jgi:tight adherence protein C
MEMNYLVLSSVLLGLTAGAIVFAMTRKLIAFFNENDENNNAGESRNDSILMGIVIPIARKMEKNRNYEKDITEANRLINITGKFWGGLSGAEVLAMRYVTALGGVIWGVVFCCILQLNAFIVLCVSAFAAIVMFMLPQDSLKREAQKRQAQFQRQLPGALDLLLIAVRTGLDLRSSIIYVADNYIDGAIKEELQKAKQSLTFGETLSDALLKTAYRMDVAEFSTLVIAITQSIETGTSIANTLATTAAEMRNSRLLTAKEEAQKVTVKITFPMLLLIVPGVFIVLLGPVILKLIFKG